MVIHQPESARFHPENIYWYENFNEVKSALSEAEIYVADQNKKVIGFIGLIDNYIAGIFVSQHMQLHGIGKQLLVCKKATPGLTIACL
ncbi:MAG: GNAT family N-acetyltransferase [Coprobacter fastidiosus]